MKISECLIVQAQRTQHCAAAAKALATTTSPTTPEPIQRQTEDQGWPTGFPLSGRKESPLLTVLLELELLRAVGKAGSLGEEEPTEPTQKLGGSIPR